MSIIPTGLIPLINVPLSAIEAKEISLTKLKFIIMILSLLSMRRMMEQRNIIHAREHQAFFICRIKGVYFLSLVYIFILRTLH